MDTKRKITIEHCKEIAIEKGGKCLSEKYENNKLKMLWECISEHKWYASYDHIQRGSWCLDCSGSKPKTIEDCHILASVRSGKCLSQEYKNNKTKILWECKLKHKWYACYHDIQQGKWCMDCANKKPKTIEDCQKLASVKNGKCLSVEIKNIKTKLLWKCKFGHEWYSRYNDIQQGHWCPECLCKNQSKLFNLLKKIYQNYEHYFNFKEFDWLKTKKNKKQHIDIFIKNNINNFSLAVEYDGIQHFKPIEYFGGEERLKYTQKLDEIKNQKIKEHPGDVKYFIRFNYKDKIDQKSVIKKLQENNIPIDLNSYFMNA